MEVCFFTFSSRKNKTTNVAVRAYFNKPLQLVIRYSRFDFLYFTALGADTYKKHLPQLTTPF
jgi:hypothetical protein